MRKSPIKHKVRSHKKKGKVVQSYLRGSGVRRINLANPTPINHIPIITTLTYESRKRLLKKLGVPEWYGWDREDIPFEKLPTGAKQALLAEANRERRIVQKFQSDPAKMQVELVLDHAKRLVDAGKDTFEAWNTAVQQCKFQYKKGVTLDPFGYEIKLTDEYIQKLEDYAKQIQKKRQKVHGLKKYEPEDEIDREYCEEVEFESPDREWARKEQSRPKPEY